MPQDNLSAQWFCCPMALQLDPFPATSMLSSAFGKNCLMHGFMVFFFLPFTSHPTNSWYSRSTARVRTCNWDCRPLVCSPSAHLPFTNSPSTSTHLWHFQNWTLRWRLLLQAWVRGTEPGIWGPSDNPLFKMLSFLRTKALPPAPLCPFKGHYYVASEAHQDIICDIHRSQQSVTGCYSRKMQYLWQISHLPSSLNDIAKGDTTNRQACFLCSCSLRNS